MSFGKKVPPKIEMQAFTVSRGDDFSCDHSDASDNLVKIVFISFAAVIAWIVIFIGFAMGFISGSPEIVLRYFFWIACFLGLSYWIEHVSSAIRFFKNKPSGASETSKEPELSETAKLQKQKADAFIKWVGYKAAFGAAGFVATLFLLQSVTGKPMLYLTQELMQGRIEGVEFKNVYKNFDDVNQALNNVNR